MSRRTSRSAARKPDADPRPAADDSPRPRPSPARPRKWFLAGAVLVQAVWIGFLVILALVA